MNKFRLLLVTNNQARVLETIPADFKEAVQMAEAFFKTDDAPIIGIVQIQAKPEDRPWYCPIASMRLDNTETEEEFELVFVDDSRKNVVSLIRWVDWTEIKGLAKQYIEFMLNEVQGEPKQQFQLGKINYTTGVHTPMMRRFVKNVEGSSIEEWREMGVSPEI